MKDILKKVKSKYIVKNIYTYTPFKKAIKIIKYSKKYINKIDYSVDDIKTFLFFNKIIKPISNFEDYLPIIIRILSPKLSYNHITNLFLEYLNKNNNEFIPQINKIKGNELFLDKLNAFKIGFNKQFLDYFINFYNEDRNLYFKKLSEFCQKYGKKIKEITFMDDNNIQKEFDILIYFFTIKYIINNSEVEKIEDRFFNMNNIESILTDIYNECYDFLIDENSLIDMDLFPDYSSSLYYQQKEPECFKYLNKLKTEKDITQIIKELKSYSLYFNDIPQFKNSELISSLCGIVLHNGKKIEELKITKIDKNNALFFIHSIKHLSNLKSLIISYPITNKLFFDRLSKRIKKNSLTKLEICVNYFEHIYKIIDKNKNSLKELTIKINCKNKINNGIIQRISNITNLKKLKLIAEFQIIDEDNIKYLSLQEVEYLEIPLYINNNFFDLNLFFEKLPKLKKLIFYGINFKNINKENLFNIIKINTNYLKCIKKINFLNSTKNSSFFIVKILELFSQNKIIKEQIKEIKIKNCDFANEATFNNLLKLISSFTYIKSLSLNNLMFDNVEGIIYNEINNFDYLQKFEFKGLNFQKNDVHLSYFLYKFIEKCRYLNELGFSCKGLNPYDINLIIKVVKNLRLLIKLNVFDNYSKEDYFTNKEEKFYLTGINIGELNDYCLFDLRNINLKKSIISLRYQDYEKININKYFHIKDNNIKFCNKKEKYFIYQNLFEHDSYVNKLFYSGKKKSFIVGNINHFSNDELEEK